MLLKKIIVLQENTYLEVLFALHIFPFPWRFISFGHTEEYHHGLNLRIVSVEMIKNFCEQIH